MLRRKMEEARTIKVTLIYTDIILKENYILNEDGKTFSGYGTFEFTDGTPIDHELIDEEPNDVPADKTINLLCDRIAQKSVKNIIVDVVDMDEGYGLNIVVKDKRMF